MRRILKWWIFILSTTLRFNFFFKYFSKNFFLALFILRPIVIIIQIPSEIRNFSIFNYKLILKIKTHIKIKIRDKRFNIMWTSISRKFFIKYGNKIWRKYFIFKQISFLFIVPFGRDFFWEQQNLLKWVSEIWTHQLLIRLVHHMPIRPALYAFESQWLF